MLGFPVSAPHRVKGAGWENLSQVLAGDHGERQTPGKHYGQDGEQGSSSVKETRMPDCAPPLETQADSPEDNSHERCEPEDGRERVREPH